MTITGWRSRGYLPHCDEEGLVQHLIFGLNDGFRAPPPAINDVTERARWADREFDVGHGSRLLARPELASIVQNSLLHGDGEQYALAAWCVMPTHVHVVIELLRGGAVSEIVQRWKSFSAHKINETADRKGALWQREYFDRFMRSEQQFDWTVVYVENNPVAARLVEKPQDWQFSSARWRRNAGEDAGAP
jgi:REP element-mobilizing transposase RayT